jgi:hypothetical protein
MHPVVRGLSAFYLQRFNIMSIEPLRNVDTANNSFWRLQEARLPQRQRPRVEEGDSFRYPYISKPWFVPTRPSLSRSPGIIGLVHQSSCAEDPRLEVVVVVGLPFLQELLHQGYQRDGAVLFSRCMGCHDCSPSSPLLHIQLMQPHRNDSQCPMNQAVLHPMQTPVSGNISESPS